MVARSPLPQQGVAPVRVLFLGHTGLLGGAEVMLEHMAKGISAHGIHPIVAIGSDGPLVDRLRRAGIAVHVVPVGALVGARRTRVPVQRRLLLDGVNWVRAVRRLIRDLEIDVVVTNSQKAHLAGSVAARISGVPVVWRLHDIVVPETFGPAQVLALRLTATLSRPRVLGVSAAVDTAARRTLGISDSTTVHNGVDVGRLRAQWPLDLRRRFGWPPECVVFGMLGRLVRWKGGLELVEAAGRVVQSAPLARFVLVGDEIIDAEAGFRNELVRRIDELGIADRVRLLPFIDDVGAVLAGLDVLVQPSIEPDPFPTAVVEAAVMGVPVVGTNHGGLPEIVTDGAHGRLVEPASIAGLAEACVELALDEPLRARMASTIREDSAGLTAPRMCAGLAEEIRGIADDRRLTSRQKSPLSGPATPAARRRS